MFQWLAVGPTNEIRTTQESRASIPVLWHQPSAIRSLQWKRGNKLVSVKCGSAHKVTYRNVTFITNSHVISSVRTAVHRGDVLTYLWTRCQCFSSLSKWGLFCRQQWVYNNQYVLSVATRVMLNTNYTFWHRVITIGPLQTHGGTWHHPLCSQTGCPKPLTRRVRHKVRSSTSSLNCLKVFPWLLTSSSSSPRHLYPYLYITINNVLYKAVPTARCV